MESQVQSISESVFSVEQDMDIYQSYAIDIEEEDASTREKRKSELLYTSQPAVILSIANEKIERIKRYDSCKQLQQNIKDSLALISHTADQAKNKMQYDCGPDSSVSLDFVAAVNPLRDEKKVIKEINNLKEEIKEINKIINIPKSTNSILIESELLKFPSQLQDSHLELLMEQSKDRGQHEIHINNKTYHEFDSLILYEEKTARCYKKLPKIKPNSSIDLKIEFQYDALHQFQILNFKILAFGRIVSNICNVSLMSIRAIQESQEHFSFKIVSHTSNQYAPELFWWPKDNPRYMESKPLGKFSVFGVLTYKKLPKFEGSQTCVELRINNAPASKIYVLGN
ncbi:unnamed protein product [Blepharisma stoltei]|uniref:Uncharacterized protein n=1 Tax=Blepharisma stoltei TaxID=1481888 RepID=A0AAU9JBN2_9CILI|nr:unnamed protein product [Blepharisma stoltei]